MHGIYNITINNMGNTSVIKINTAKKSETPFFSNITVVHSTKQDQAKQKINNIRDFSPILVLFGWYTEAKRYI